MSSFDAVLDVPPRPAAAQGARHVVRTLLGLWGAADRAEDAALVLTELITNAIEHVGGEASLRVQLTLADGWLRLSVADGSSVRPVLRQLSGLEERGRGVLIIQSIADRWGSEDHHGGKRVWVELGPPST